MLKGQGKISRREVLIFFPTRLQRENAMIIINVTFRYVLPLRLRRANAVIIYFISINTLSDLGDLSNLIGSLSRTI